jgi:hypothetical protein
MSKVWFSSPYTFITNSFLICGLTALMGRQNFLVPQSWVWPPKYSLFLSGLYDWGCSIKGSLHSMDGKLQLVINNIDATY